MSKITIDRAVAEQALEALLNEGEFRKILKPLIEKSIDSIRDALEQPYAGPPVTAPEGWKLVPKILTEEMEDAGCEAIDTYHRHDIARAWEVMLNTAPQQKNIEQQKVYQEPYLYYDTANGDTWTQEAIDDGLRQSDGLIALYTK